MWTLLQDLVISMLLVILVDRIVFSSSNCARVTLSSHHSPLLHFPMLWLIMISRLAGCPQRLYSPRIGLTFVLPPLPPHFGDYTIDSTSPNPNQPILSNPPQQPPLPFFTRNMFTQIHDKNISLLCSLTPAVRPIVSCSTFGLRGNARQELSRMTPVWRFIGQLFPKRRDVFRLEKVWGKSVRRTQRNARFSI